MPYFRKRMVWEILNHKLLWCQSEHCELVQWAHSVTNICIHQLFRSGTTLSNVHIDLGWWDVAWEPITASRSCSPGLGLWFTSGVSVQQQENSTFCISQTELVVKSHLYWLTDHTLSSNVQFDANTVYKFVMLHIYNDSNTIFWSNCQCLILLLCAEFRFIIKMNTPTLAGKFGFCI